jgi:hypothetical protein
MQQSLPNLQPRPSEYQQEATKGCKKQQEEEAPKPGASSLCVSPCVSLCARCVKILTFTIVHSRQHPKPHPLQLPSQLPNRLKLHRPNPQLPRRLHIHLAVIHKQRFPGLHV